MNPNKRFTDLKVKQQELISEWLYTATYSFYRDKKRMPNKSERIVILDTVYYKIEEAGIWIPYNEVRTRYLSRLIHFEKRAMREINRE
ncbi:MAG: hypothetical protein J6B01_07785 [Ruminococcus sp.]|nr:hypothetical protein [Ruminococcus sp.]